MELNLIQPKIHKLSQNFDFFFKNQTQSIKNLVHELENEVSDKTSILAKFHELIQASVDPPLESIWIYSDLTFRKSNVTNGDVLDQISIVKGLFQCVSACSASCSASKSIALLAPVVYEVYRLVCELWRNDLSRKSEKKAMRKCVSLIEAILGYVSVCWCKNFNGEDDGLVDAGVSFLDLVGLSMWRNGCENDDVRLFFPLAGEDASKKVVEGECDVSYLAGVVALEAFLLRLCLKFHGGRSKQEMEKELRNWAVGSITSLKSYEFYEALLRMLLESTLPVTSLLNAEDEKLLRKVLYDAVILVDYSFLNIGKEMQPPSERMNRIYFTRLIVTHEAVEFFRKNRDSKRAISYLTAFSGSSLPSQVIRLATRQIGIEGIQGKPKGSSPKALIKWLLNLEDQGIRIFADSISECFPKLVDNLSNPEYDQTLHDADDMKLDSEIFFVDKKGEDKEKEHDKKDKIKARKRKGRISKNINQFKFLKYNVDTKSESAKGVSFVTNDGSDGENPLSDEDMK